MISRKPLQAQYNFEMFYLYLHCGGCFKCTKHHSYSILRWLDRSLGPNWALTASRISRFYLTLLEMSQLYAMSFQACEAQFPSCLAKFGNFMSTTAAFLAHSLMIRLNSPLMWFPTSSTSPRDLYSSSNFRDAAEPLSQSEPTE